MKATEFLHKAASLLEERGKQYDQPQGERSMGKAVTAFNAITSRDLSEAEGWLLLQVLKDVRQWQNPERYHADSAEDCVSYAALKAEALYENPVQQILDSWEEPAYSIDDESPRAQAVAQNGNTAEHYRWNPTEGIASPFPSVPHAAIDILHRDGSMTHGIENVVLIWDLDQGYWKHTGDGTDIVAWRFAE